MNTPFDARMASIEKALKEEAAAYKAVLQKAKDEQRQPNEDERNEISEHVEEIERLKVERDECQKNIDTHNRVNETEASLGSPSFRDFERDVEVKQQSAAETKSLGEEFLEQKGYKELIEKGFTSSGWQNIANFDMTVPEMERKATLFSTPGTALTPREYQPGIVQTLFQRNYVSDLLGSATTNASQVTYVTETTATNAAAAVAEGTAKPQSTLAFGETTESVRKLATILPVSEEMLADAPQIQAYINQRLMLFIKNVEETQILLGSGTAPNIQGLIGAGRNSVGTYARGTVDDNALALFKAMNGTRGSSQLDMDAIVIHPTNWQAIRTAKDTSGQYYGGGPFYGPYGGPQGPAGASQFSADNLWGVRVVVTSNITVGSALVGAFGQGGAVYRRQGVTVDATNSHSTWFADNLTAIRAEERLALAVYRQSAFTVVTGLA